MAGASTAQLANYLFKKSLNIGTTNTNTEYFSESKTDYAPIYPLQVWAQQSIIPATAPVLPPDGVDGTGTVQYKVKLPLTALPSGVAFYSPDLINAIPFNYDPLGSYNYTVYDNTGTNQIPFGVGNWFVDNGSGILLFFGTLPANMPPQITFYKYVGILGISSVPITDANGITVFSDGPNGSNPVNKSASAITNAFYDRNENGFITLNGADPPAGLSDIAPYGTVDNSPNWTQLNRKIQTINNSAVDFIYFPSHIGNKQSYAVVINALGTSSAPLGETIAISTTTSFYYLTRSGTVPLNATKNGTIPILPSSLDIVYDGLNNRYAATITGTNGYTIEWLISIQFIQYRVSA